LPLAGGQVIHLRGKIDRLDVEGKRLLVRDLKTGRAKPRHGDQAEAVLALDLQLAVYGLVARQLAREWKVPGKVDIAYVFPDVAGEHERAFRGSEFDDLAERARGWLGTAIRLLAEGSFPRTPLEKDDCTICAFNVVCGSEGPSRASELFARSEGALREYGVLRVPPEPEEDE
jgi:RecB family exonuclease